MPLSWIHQTLQIVMGWDDSHLYEFRINGETYSDSRGDLWEPIGGKSQDACNIHLSKVITAVKQEFVYTYDFGDDWQHELLVEKIIAPGECELSLVYLAGERACPPEDFGGSCGYADFLEIISDPRHPEYDERIEWVGGEFDPDRFDLKKLNLELSKILRA